jgi:hypothetical protein
VCSRLPQLFVPFGVELPSDMLPGFVDVVQPVAGPRNLQLSSPDTKAPSLLDEVG